jgi:hypothetical protein
VCTHCTCYRHLLSVSTSQLLAYHSRACKSLSITFPPCLLHQIFSTALLRFSPHSPVLALWIVGRRIRMTPVEYCSWIQFRHIGTHKRGCRRTPSHRAVLDSRIIHDGIMLDHTPAPPLAINEVSNTTCAYRDVVIVLPSLRLQEQRCPCRRSQGHLG